MAIRQGSPRTDRRRRVLTEERRESAHTPPAVPVRDESRPGRRYARAVDREHLPLICDLIPLRPWTVCVWYLLQVTLWVGIAAGVFSYHAYHFAFASFDLSPLNLASDASLASGAILLNLGLTASYSWLICSFRRHKVDDYRGKYRIWYSVLILLTGLVVARATGLQATLESGVRGLLAHGGLTTPDWWLDAGLCGLGALVWGRLLVEMRACRGAVATLCAGSVAAFLASLLHFGAIDWGSGELQAIGSGLLQLAGYQMLMLAILQYARHVLRDAHGLVTVAAPVSSRPALRLRWPQLRRRRRAVAASESAETSEDVEVPAPVVTAAAPKISVRPDAPPMEHGAVTQPVPREPNAAASTATAWPEDTDDDSDSSGDGDGDHRLSRADRKRLRKEQRRGRSAA